MDGKKRETKVANEVPIRPKPHLKNINLSGSASTAQLRPQLRSCAVINRARRQNPTAVYQLRPPRQTPKLKPTPCPVWASLSKRALVIWIWIGHGKFNQDVDTGETKCKRNKQLGERARQNCDECDGDGPPKSGFWGEQKCNKTSNLTKRAIW